MPRVALVQVVYNSMRYIPQVFPAALSQSYDDSQMVAVIAASTDGSREYIESHFPQVKIIDPGYNVGFALGHNMVFSSVDAEFFQLINPDLIVRPDFVEKMLEAMVTSPRIGAVGGKLLQYDFENRSPKNTIDSTGVIIRRTGRALDRGQHEVDTGQYDDKTELMAVSGAGAMFRAKALNDTAERHGDSDPQFFDEDFHSYFEDVDLCWRMFNQGWHIRYQPKALAWHGRAIGSDSAGYANLSSYVRHRERIPLKIRRQNYRNHLSLYLKNSPGIGPSFLFREFFYNLYILVFETAVLKALPDTWRQFPATWRKRKTLARHRSVSRSEATHLME